MEPRYMRSVPAPLLAPSADEPRCLQQSPEMRSTSESRPETPKAGLDGVSRAWGRRWEPQAREETQWELAQPTWSEGFQLHRWLPASESEKSRGFLHRIFGNLWWRNTGLLFNPLMWDKIWDGPQHSELRESFASHTDCPVGFQEICWERTTSSFITFLVQFHTLRDRSRLFCYCETWPNLADVGDKVWVQLNTPQFWRNQHEV